MDNFVFQSPTKIYFGSHQEDNVGKIISELGYSNILFVYGKNSIKKSGLYTKVIKSLEENNIKFTELHDIQANPLLSKVNEGVKIARQNKIDFILAVGGGSVIDTAKSIAHGYFYDGSPFDFNEHLQESHQALKIGVILTISAAGSELSDSCVITDETRKLKRGFNNPLSRPVFAIENPELTKTVSFYQVSCGIVDILSHTLERYFNASKPYQLADYLAEGLLKDVIACGRALINNHQDEDALSNLMLASSLSHNGLTSIGKLQKMPVHQLEHELSGLDENIPHGAGLAILIPAWMKEVYIKDIKKFKMFAKNVMMVSDGDNDEEICLRGIEELEKFIRSLAIEKSLSEFNITEEDIEVMANKLTKNGTYVFPSNIPLDKESALKIYRRALGAK